MIWLALCVMGLTAGASAIPAVISAQGAARGVEESQPPVIDPTAPTTAQEREAWEREFGPMQPWRYRRNVFRLGQDFQLRSNDSARDVAVVFGTARIGGRIDGDLVVVLGETRLESTAVIDGSLILVGGEASIAPGALVRADVVVVGTTAHLPPGFVFGGEHVVIGTPLLGTSLQRFVPWLTTGLLWGRPIVPSVGWVWLTVGFFLLVYLLVNLLLHEPVRATADVLARRPFGAFIVGLLTMLLWAPIAALLGVSIIGIIVIPFFLCALVVAGVVGRVSVFRWIGNSVIAPDDAESRPQALRSFAIGFALITLVYMVPLLGLVTWGLIGVFGLGAAVMAFLSAWRKESPKKPGGVGASTTPLSASYVAPSEFATPPPAPAPPMPPAPPAPTAAPGPSTPPASPAPSGVAFASFLERAAAFGLDVLMIGVLHEGLEGWLLPRYGESYLPLLLIYFIAFWTWKGTTIGGTIMRLKIVKTNGRPFEAADAIVRGLTGVLSFAALGIGVLWILRDPEHQGWHDKAVGTWVVKDE
jgi:uncharacterized RDD family membrane protein YckC